MCEHLAQTARTLAASYATIPYCVVSYPLSDMAPSHCLAANTLLPPQWWVLPCCIHDITPFLSHWDSAWHADNAHFLAPNIGESCIRKPTSLFPHSRPPYSADHHGPTPTCNGYFLRLDLLNLFGRTDILNKLNVYHCKMSCFRHLYAKKDWMAVSAICSLFLCWVSLRWRSWIYNTIPSLYSATEQPFS